MSNGRFRELIKKNNIAGIDEVGVGCIAGPLVAAMVVVDKYTEINSDITDSKKISESRRELYSDYIKESVPFWRIVSMDVKDIDRTNVYQSCKIIYSMLINPNYKNNIYNCKILQGGYDEEITPDYIVLDGINNPEEIPKQFKNGLIVEPKADLNWYPCSAASIIAKVFRDNYMINLSNQYPQYEFQSHKGYCTKKHSDIVEDLGRISGLHRECYKFPFEKRR